LHDLVSRPLERWIHGYAGCGWHHSSFDIESGRVLYRWRVNKILARSDLGRRLAEEGDDVGRLVTVTDEARTELTQAVVAREDGEPADGLVCEN
jgi:nitrite reductase/ring-hydroxylating ferredoxin subunit